VLWISSGAGLVAQAKKPAAKAAVILKVILNLLSPRAEARCYSQRLRYARRKADSSAALRNDKQKVQ